VQDVFDYVGEFSFGDICVHVRDVEVAESYIVIDVNLFKVMNEAY
jgi:hypothetical protein